jgi:hypothetical protein
MCLPTFNRRLQTDDGAATENAERWLGEATAGWGDRYPDVTIHPATVSDDPIDGLVRTAQGRRLLVVGLDHSAHLPGKQLGSVATGVVSRAPCAVAAVPVGSSEARRGRNLHGHPTTAGKIGRHHQNTTL